MVTKTELIDHVWDSAADVTPNTVEVYAGYLRRKIGPDRLLTVRGVGYRLRPVNWRLSLRARLMIIGLTGVAVALIMGGLAFYGALTLSINRALDNEALASARDVAAMVNENRLPNPVPVSGAQVIQVVDAQQRVVGGSVTADRLTPLLRPDELERALAGEAVVVDGVRLGIDEPLRVRAVPAGRAADAGERDRGGPDRGRAGHPDRTAQRLADHHSRCCWPCWG